MAAAEPVHGEGIFKETIRHEAARRQAGRRRARWTGRLALAAAAAAAAVLSVVVLTRPDQDRVDTDGGPLATQPTAPPTTGAEPAPDATGAPAGPSTTLPTTTSTPTSTPTTAPEVELPAFPPEFTDLTHRGEAWGLYLAVAGPDQYDAPQLATADTWAEEAGYGPSGAGELGCDQGAAEALGVDPMSAAVAVYFRTEAEAEQARAAFEARGHAVAGVAFVLTGCLD